MPKKVADIKQRNSLISWQAPDFIYHRKTTGWYLMVCLIAVILIAVFYLLKDTMGYAGIAVVAAAILALFSNARIKPEIIKYEINNNGIIFKNKEYEFSELKSFYIDEENFPANLYLEQNGKLRPHLSISLGKINPQLVKNFLLQKLPENPGLKQNLNETLSNIIRF